MDAIERARKRFFNALPQRLTCPCCEQNRKKDAFGVRLVNKADVEENDAKPVFYRQSQCNTCRG